jgi:hypothetical protein
MNKLIHLVMDYAPGDLALAEVTSALAAQIPPDYHWHLTSVDSFDTVSTGFVTAQLARMSHGNENLIIYSNCAPRKDLKIARANNEGEGLLYGVLKNGVTVFVVNSGYSLSFVKNDLHVLRKVNVSDAGSQFRSRDNFPKAIGAFTSYLENGFVTNADSILGDELDPMQVIPDAPNCAIGYVDSFGNLKTTIRDGDDALKDIEPGQRVSIEINGVTMSATASTGSFNVQEGDIAFSPGSSGGDRRYWEIFQRGGSAWHTYKKPRAGSHILINAKVREVL